MTDALNEAVVSNYSSVAQQNQSKFVQNINTDCPKWEIFNVNGFNLINGITQIDSLTQEDFNSTTTNIVTIVQTAINQVAKQQENNLKKWLAMGLTIQESNAGTTAEIIDRMVSLSSTVNTSCCLQEDKMVFEQKLHLCGNYGNVNLTNNSYMNAVSNCLIHDVTQNFLEASETTSIAQQIDLCLKAQEDGISDIIGGVIVIGVLIVVVIIVVIMWALKDPQVRDSIIKTAGIAAV